MIDILIILPMLLMVGWSSLLFIAIVAIVARKIESTWKSMWA